jgi:hypothetical protein
MPIGDVNSTALGSGARYNDGKPNLALIPAWITAQVALHSRDITIAAAADHRAWIALSRLGDWQRGAPHGDFLHEALLSLDQPLIQAARVFEFGAKKYAAWNWLKGMAWSIPLACAQRHALAIMRGELLDDDSGLSHEGHLACNLIMLMQFELTFPQGDDITFAKILPNEATKGASVQ